MEISDIVGQYVLSRRTAGRPLSIASALTAIRTVDGKAAVTDRELSDMIAAAAVARGMSVDFDSGIEQPARPSRLA